MMIFVCGYEKPQDFTDGYRANAGIRPAEWCGIFRSTADGKDRMQINLSETTGIHVL